MSDVLTIQQASEQCGVNPVTLRAWERRYGLLKPERTASSLGGKGRAHQPGGVLAVRGAGAAAVSR